MTDHQPSPPERTPVDLGNDILGPAPAALAVSQTIAHRPRIDADGAIIEGPDGPVIDEVTLIVLTIRTNSTTLTVFLDEQQADGWANTIKQLTGHSRPGLIIPNGLPTLEPGVAEAIDRERRRTQGGHS